MSSKKTPAPTPAVQIFDDEEELDEDWNSTANNQLFIESEFDSNNFEFSAPAGSPARSESPLFVPNDLPVDPVDNANEDPQVNERETIVKSFDFGSEEYLFCAVIGRSGVLLTDPFITMERDEANICTYLNNWTSGKIPGEGGPEKIQQFQRSMERYFATGQNMRAALHPCIIRGNGKMIQKSLFQILLTVKGLQKPTATFLFQLIETYSLVAESTEEVRELRLTLEQFKWISNWKDIGFIYEELIKFIDNGTEIGQGEIIKTLPEIIPSDWHQKVSVYLLNLVEFGKNIPIIMECLSDIDLSLSDGNIIYYHHKIIEQMTNAQLVDFPAYFGFLLKRKSPKILGPTIDKIRGKIVISSISNDTRGDIYMGEIVEKIRFQLILNPNIVSVWSKFIKKELMVKGKIHALDMIMLLIFADSSHNVSPIVKGIFKQKDLVEEIFKSIYEDSVPIILKVLESFLKICDGILQGKDNVSIRVVSEILVNIFGRIDMFESQEIINIFCLNFINGSFDARSIIIDALFQMSKSFPVQMLAFSPRFMEILDYIDRFPFIHLKGIVNVLVQLAFIEGNAESMSFFSQLSLMSRKQITHTLAKVRCYGVISNLSIIRQMCVGKGEGDSFNEEEGKIDELLKISWSFVEKDAYPCILFFDELCEIVDILPEKILTRYEGIFLDKFLENWTRSMQKIKEYKTPIMKMDLQFGVNSNLDDEDAIGLVVEGTPFGMDPSVIPSHLKLIRLMHEKLNGNVEQIKSIIGNPILFPKIFGQSPKEVPRITFAQMDILKFFLIRTINLFRELVSGFIPFGSDDNKVMLSIWFRIYNIVKLQKFLVSHFKRLTSLPIAYPMDGESGLCANQLGQGSYKMNTKSGQKRKAKGVQGVGTKKKKSKSVQSLNEDEPGSTSADFSADIDLLSDSIQPDPLFKFIRRLDSKVFSLLNNKLETGIQPELDTQSFEIILLTASSTPPAEATINTISIEMEVLLLVELIQQIRDKRKLDIFSVKKILFSICKHLDQLMVIFESESEPNPPNSNRLYECFTLLLQVLYLYFEEMEYCEQNKKKKIMDHAIGLLWKKSVSDPNEFKNLSAQEKISRAVEYLMRFAGLLMQPEEAIAHLKFLSKLGETDELQHFNFKTAITDASLLYLKRDWNLDSHDAGVILETLLQSNMENLTIIKGIVDEIIPTNDNALIPDNDTFKSCRIENLHGWISLLFSYMAKIVFKNTDAKNALEESRRLWMDAFDIYKRLVNVSAKLQQDAILEPILKFSRSFLGLIIQDGLKLVKWICENEPNNIRPFIKNIQMPARRLYYICTHAKAKKRTVLMRHVPFIMSLIEKILVRVMAIVVATGYSKDMLFGHLKRRTLKGEELPKTRYQETLENEEDFTQSNLEDFSQIWNYNIDANNEEEKEEEPNEMNSPDSLSDSILAALADVECLLGEEIDGGEGKSDVDEGGNGESDEDGGESDVDDGGNGESDGDGGESEEDVGKSDGDNGKSDVDEGGNGESDGDGGESEVDDGDIGKSDEDEGESAGVDCE